MEPFAYRVTAGRDVDVGFLKIYLSTKAFDLSGIAQGTAFTQDRAPVAWRNRTIETWDTILIPVIQHRKPTSGQSGWPRPQQWQGETSCASTSLMGRT